MHRALSIVQAIATAHVSDTVRARVFENGIISLDDETQELPAIDVSLASDSPVSEFGTDNLAYIDSLLDVKVTMYAKASSKQDLLIELMRLRSASHQVVMAGDRAHGLSYVIDTRYGGAAEPEVNTDGSMVTGILETAYTVHYRMAVSTPE